MPIVMKVEDGRFRPAVYCDFCGQEIGDAKAGNCQWRKGDEPEGNGAALSFIHKECCRPFEEAQDGDIPWGAEDLDCFLASLGQTIRLDWEVARKNARDSGATGSRPEEWVG